MYSICTLYSLCVHFVFTLCSLRVSNHCIDVDCLLTIYSSYVLTSKQPITTSLLVVETTGGPPVVKSATRGIIEAPGNYDIPDQLGRPDDDTRSIKQEFGRRMYPFKIKHLGVTTYRLFASSAAARDRWMESLIMAKTAYASSLTVAKEEPFKINVVSISKGTTSAKPDSAQYVCVKTSTMYKAIKEAEPISLPTIQDAGRCKHAVISVIQRKRHLLIFTNTRAFHTPAKTPNQLKEVHIIVLMSNTRRLRELC